MFFFILSLIYLYKREIKLYKIETYGFIYFFIHYSGKQQFHTMLAQFRRVIEPMFQTIIVWIKLYMLIVLFYLFVALSVTAIKESAHNPNHWAYFIVWIIHLYFYFY